MDRTSLAARLDELNGKLEKLPPAPLGEGPLVGHKAATDSMWKYKERVVLEAEASDIQLVLDTFDRIAIAPGRKAIGNVLDRAVIASYVAELSTRAERLPTVALPIGGPLWHSREVITESEWQVRERQAVEKEVRLLGRALEAFDHIAAPPIEAPAPTSAESTIARWTS